MRDEIQRVMAAEKEARQILDEADSERDRILREARIKAEELIARSRLETRKETETIVADAIKQGEQEKEGRLAQIAADIENQIHLDDTDVEKAVEMVVRSVCGRK